MKRRELLRGAGLAAVATGLAACAPRPEGEAGTTAAAERLHWKMVTSWPTNFPGLGTGAAKLAEMITLASGGRLTVKVYGAGELVPAFEVFDAVSRGTAEMGHSASYYWKGKAAAAPFFCAVPFGLNAQEMNGWLYQAVVWSSGANCMRRSAWCRSRRAIPGCRWLAGSASRSNRWPTSRA
ncbi:hypothetical protein [Arenimonas daejeonensis]|uniref:hypothetical protein n=1 Tax=Arenimonas daejeonensis TaxID=370777 RepID=UPI0022404146|nr:hypothetical protein [Arenimonas daejeonensis]